MPEVFVVHLKAQTFIVQQWYFFLPLFSCNFGDQLGSSFHRFVIYACWDTQSENTGSDNYPRCPVPLTLQSFVWALRYRLFISVVFRFYGLLPTARPIGINKYWRESNLVFFLNIHRLWKGKLTAVSSRVSDGNHQVINKFNSPQELLS